MQKKEFQTLIVQTINAKKSPSLNFYFTII